MKKTYVLFSAIAVCLIVIMLACQKTDSYEGQLGTKRAILTVEEARKSFNLAMKQIEFHDHSNCEHDHEEPVGLIPGEFTPLWDEAIPTTNSAIDVVNVPIISQYSHVSISPEVIDGNLNYRHAEIFQRLIVFKRYDAEDSPITSYILTLVPSPDYLVDNPYFNYDYLYGGENVQFDGIILIKSLEGQFVSILQSRSGIITRGIYVGDMMNYGEDEWEDEILDITGPLIFRSHPTSVTYRMVDPIEIDPVVCEGHVCARCKKGRCICPFICPNCNFITCRCMPSGGPNPAILPLPGGGTNPGGTRLPTTGEKTHIERAIERIRSICLSSWLSTQTKPIATPIKMNHTLNSLAAYDGNAGHILLKNTTSGAEQLELNLVHELMHTYQHQYTGANFISYTQLTQYLLNAEFEANMMGLIYINTQRAKQGTLGQGYFSPFGTSGWAIQLMTLMKNETNNFTKTPSSSFIQNLFNDYLGNYKNDFWPNATLLDKRVPSLKQLISSSPC